MGDKFRTRMEMKLMDLMKVMDIPFSLEYRYISSLTVIYPVDYKKAGLIIDDVRTFYLQPVDGS
jgi:hypothetical protein